MRKRTSILLLVTAILTFSATVGVSKQESSKEDDFYTQVELFADAVTIIKSEYVEETKDKDLIYGALKGMLSSLDPYSQFM